MASKIPVLEDVFGVSRNPVLSYHERLNVDGFFQDALKSDKQIIVYGSSKQGKTALVNKHAPYSQNIMVSLTPKSTLLDIYKKVLREIGYVSVTEEESTNTNGEEISVGTTLKASLPFIAEGKASMSGSVTTETGGRIVTHPISINLESPDDISTALKKAEFSKIIILENFHYLPDDVQCQLAFDLRAFQELGIRFIILGVWREKNRLAQYNGDLLDRIIEIPVEPWEEDDLREVIKKGSKILNIRFSDELVQNIIGCAFDSIGVVQELIRKVCLAKSVVSVQAATLEISDMEVLKKAVKEKAEEYSSRHIRALESIAEGQKSTQQTRTGEVPLFLPYYTVKAFLTTDFESIQNGVRREKLEETIKSFHHRADGVRAGDMTNLLNGFAELQSKKNITPPIFDYDKNNRTMRVVDSTFYFFLKNINRDEVLANLNNPVDSASEYQPGLF